MVEQEKKAKSSQHYKGRRMKFKVEIGIKITGYTKYQTEMEVSIWKQEKN